MDSHSRRIRNARQRIYPADNGVGVGDAPWDGGFNSPVAVARDVAADPADAVGKRQRRRANVRGLEPRNAFSPHYPRRRQYSADYASVPRKTRSAVNKFPRVANKAVPFLDNEQYARADEA